MNKKLLCSTALAGALIVSGSALAELKIGGNFTHTANFGSDDRSSTTTNSGERLGTEMNLTLAKTATLSNGLIATYKGNIEFDAIDSAQPDVEYEATIGTKDLYIGLGSDSGNNLSSTIALPAVGQHIGTLGQLVSQTNPLNWDSLIGPGGEANNESHVSLNAKAAGGTFSVIYTPNTTEGAGDNDATNINASAGGSAMAILYTGNPVPNVGFIIGRNTEKADTDTAATEIEIDKIGASYNFGKIRAGYDYQKREVGTLEQTANNFSVTFAASDNLTIGAQYSKADQNTAGTHDEKIMALSAGYNLGGASIAVSLVDVENLGATGTAGIDSQGVVITTKIGF